MIENVEKFVNEFSEALSRETFIKLTLSNYKGSEPNLQKVLIRVIKTKKGIRLFYLYRYDTRDTAKNYNFPEGIKILTDILGNTFLTGHLFTTENDFQIEIGKKGKSRLNIAKPTFKTIVPAAHDKVKKRIVDQNSSYLQVLNITTDTGQIRERQHDKWKQINKFVETLHVFFSKSNLKDCRKLRIVDMGCGKGYLTFAAYDYFTNTLGLDVSMTGVDTKSQLVGLCNDLAKTCDFNELEFVEGWIGDYDLNDVNILIALHACNTATDDAIFKGIRANADLILAAPCCHKEIRPQIIAPPMFNEILKHGVMLERTAETITDGLRALLLERSGYSTKLFEFVATEHTPKNNILVGTKQNGETTPDSIQTQIDQIKDFYGIKEQRLETLLDSKV